MNKPTTMTELADYLQEEGYQSYCYHVGPGWFNCGDTYCIELTSAGYEAFYVERGQRSKSLWIEEYEPSACIAFVALLDREPSSRSHCIASSMQSAGIERIAELLASRGIRSTRNDIPNFNGPNETRFRLFVTGRDKHLVDKMIAERQLSLVLFD